MSIADIAESNELLKLDECLMKYKAILVERSPTAKQVTVKIEDEKNNGLRGGQYKYM